MKKLILGLMITLYGISVNASDTFTVDGIKYETISLSEVKIVGWTDAIPSIVNVGTIKWNGEIYFVRAIGQYGFYGCKNMSIILPECITVESGAFQECENSTVYLQISSDIKKDAFVGSKLKYIIVSSQMKSQIMSNPGYYGLRNTDNNVRCLLFENDIKNMQYKMFLKDYYNDDVDENDYIFSCEHYGITPIRKPQIVQDDEIVIKKESIQSAKVETISISNNTAIINVNVCTNNDITVETANWNKAKITDCKLNDDGTVTLTVPVSSQSGFIILQTGDARITSEGQFVTRSEPWYSSTPRETD